MDIVGVVLIVEGMWRLVVVFGRVGENGEMRGGMGGQGRMSRRDRAWSHGRGPRIFFFFNDTETTEIYTILFVGSVKCV